MSMISLMVFGIAGNAILGSWIGWGVAHWRFASPPPGTWPFWLWPFITGAIVYGGMMLVLGQQIDSVGNESISKIDQGIAVLFATAVGPLFGIIAAAFFRYVLNATALGSGRERGDES